LFSIISGLKPLISLQKSDNLFPSHEGDSFFSSTFAAFFARGSLLKVEVLQGSGFGFEEAAVEAFKRSAFRPAMVNGQAVASIARLPIRFAIRD
jgi:TonB family protein